jgi:hypothetical protein
VQKNWEAGELNLTKKEYTEEIKSLETDIGNLLTNKVILYTRKNEMAGAMADMESFNTRESAKGRRYVVCKAENPLADADLWFGFEAAHIFPITYEQQWVENNYSRWITIDPPQRDKINSIQKHSLTS